MSVEQLEIKHKKTIWAHFANIFLGFWLLVSHIMLGYTSIAMARNDWICGIVLIVFGFLSLSPKKHIPAWIVCFTGIWLNFAPLVFWAPDSVAYLNDTIVGVAAIAFSILIPGLPGVVEPEGKALPPGWSHNPSAWIQRIPVVALGCVGWFISRYLVGYQLGYIDTVWDPVFGNGTEKVITSTVAHFFPFPDAGLGAFAYTLEALMGLKGGENRWRTMPWMVVGFGLLVVPLGFVTILLVILQPIIVGAWCFLCLCAATSMMIMVIMTLDEVAAVLQFLRMARKEGQPFWQVFWKGGEVKGIKEDTITPSLYSPIQSQLATLRYGIGFRWNLFLSALCGVWFMFTPWIFDLGPLGSDSSHLVGSLIVVTSIFSMAEVTRSLRYLNLLFALWMGITTWFFNAYGGVEWSELGTAIVLFLLTLPRGPIHGKYGGWTSKIR